jgi:hypothetical protein
MPRCYCHLATPHAGLPEGVFEKLQEVFDTPAARWVRDLPRFDCPTCGKETIFRSGCSDCQEAA